MRKLILITALGLAALVLGGCEFVDSQMLAGAREYFPRAELFKPIPQMIQIETHVGNVTKAFGDKTFRAMVDGPEGQKLRQGLAMAEYRWFILGFDDFNVVWDTRTGHYWMLDLNEMGAWWLRHIGNVQPNTEPVSP